MLMHRSRQVSRSFPGVGDCLGLKGWGRLDVFPGKRADVIACEYGGLKEQAQRGGILAGGGEGTEFGPCLSTGTGNIGDNLVDLLADGRLRLQAGDLPHPKAAVPETVARWQPGGDKLDGIGAQLEGNETVKEFMAGQGALEPERLFPQLGLIDCGYRRLLGADLPGSHGWGVDFGLGRDNLAHYTGTLAWEGMGQSPLATRMPVAMKWPR